MFNYALVLEIPLASLPFHHPPHHVSRMMQNVTAKGFRAIKKLSHFKKAEGLS